MKTWYRFKKTKKISTRNYSNLWKPLNKKISQYSIKFNKVYDSPNINDDLIEYYYIGVFTDIYFFKTEKDMILYKLKYRV